ncbi:MAG: hypothetical protein JSW43_07635 [Gemmatimonadota bacterium]|nr:MAG: hypothetical protein JSW43_07635 [Gemmatimonadota bacterium]
MTQINTGRVIAGGVLAGFIIDAFEWLSSVVFRGTYEDMYAALNLPEPGAGAMASLTLGGFAVGILLVWIYAGFRPRWGPGPKAALLAGLAVWLLGWVWQMVVDIAMGIYSLSAWMWVMALVWTFVEVQVAALAGGWLYREGETVGV